LQKRQIQLLDVCNLSPECVHSFPDSAVHVQLDYIFSPESRTKRYGVVWCNSAVCEGTQWNRTLQTWRLFQIFAMVIR
jgi:hypothetical protein